MIRLSSRSTFAVKASTFLSNNSVHRISLRCPLLFSEEEKSVKEKGYRNYNDWITQVNDLISKASAEWKRTEFFKEGGKHAISHNIRPQQEFSIPKKYVCFIVVAFIILVVTLESPDDLSESNAYFKSIKEKKSSDDSFIEK